MYANAFNYTASGGIASMRLGNGQWETAKFNNRLQVEELGLGHSATNAGTWKVNYEFGEYDPNSQTVTGSKNTGNIARQTVSFDGLPNAFVQTYQYDSLYRLTDANEMAGSSENWSEKFTYDRYGNRDKKFRNGLEITNNALSHPSIDPNTNHFTTTGYGYDKVGNLVTDAEGRNFTFDGNNKQRIVYDGNQTVGEYFYDGDGMRVKKKVYSNGTHTKTVVFVYSGGKLIEEYSTEAPPTDKKIKYLTKDHLGTPRIITDGNGAVVSRRDFMPFGEEIANNVGTRSTSSFKYSANEDDVRQKFTGYQQDSETNLDFAEARMYENRHARFTAVDPLLASGNSGNPQTFNRYVYVLNNPIALVDSSGLIPVYFSRKKGRYTTNPRAARWKSYKRYRGKAKKVHGRFNGRNEGWHWVTRNGIYETNARTGRKITRNVNRRKKKRSRNVANFGIVKEGTVRGQKAIKINAAAVGAGAVIGACIGGVCPAAARGAVVTGIAAGLKTLGTVGATTLALPETACGTGSGSIGGAGGSSSPCGGDGGSRIWTLNPIDRGNLIEDYLSHTEYSDWHRVGDEMNGTFPLVDFQQGNTLVSLKTVDTTGSTWLGRMQQHIADLANSGATVDGNPANMVLDLRVQPGGLDTANQLIEFGRERGVTVTVRELE